MLLKINNSSLPSVFRISATFLTFQGTDTEDNPWKVERPHSALEKLGDHQDTEGTSGGSGLVKGKSMPSLR